MWLLDTEVTTGGAPLASDMTRRCEMGNVRWGCDDAAKCMQCSAVNKGCKGGHKVYQLGQMFQAAKKRELLDDLALQFEMDGYDRRNPSINKIGLA